MEMYQKQPTATDVKDDPEARELLRQAFERTARWPADFKGFTADLTINVDGKETGGTVTVKSAQDVVVSLPDPELQKWATNTIGMIAVHRGPRTFDQSDGKSVLTLEPESSHPLVQTISINDMLACYYRIKDESIIQINLNMDPMNFIINLEVS